MNKTAILIIMILLLPPALMADTDNSPKAQEKAHWAEIKKIKDAKRQARLAAGKAGAKKKNDDFWDKEAKRSGFAETGESLGNFMRNLNPVPFFKSQQESYEARQNQIRSAKQQKTK